MYRKIYPFGPVSVMTIFIVSFLLLPAFSLAQSNDVTPPIISNVTSTAISGGVAISWVTDELADSRLAVYTAASCPPPNCQPPIIREVSSLTMRHNMVVMNLIPGTTYTYVVMSADAIGNETRYDNRTFFVGGSPSPTPTTTVSPTPAPRTDLTAPYISAVTITNLTPFAATINWTTNEPADGQIAFCTTYLVGCANNTPIVSTLTTSHTINLSGLTPNTYYYSWIKSRDASGNLRTSYKSFRTPASSTPTSPTPTPTTTVTPSVTPTPTPGLTDYYPPNISNITVTNLTPFAATINWTTNEPADGQIAFCTTYLIGCANNTPLVTELTTQHTINLSGLTPNTYYYMWVKSRDAAGNLRTSYRSFRTTLQ